MKIDLLTTAAADCPTKAFPGKQFERYGLPIAGCVLVLDTPPVPTYPESGCGASGAKSGKGVTIST